MNRQILDEASEWFVDFRVGDIDHAARARFSEWLRTSPEHVRAYIEIAKTYVDLPSMTHRQVDPEALIAVARSPANVVELKHRHTPPRTPAKRSLIGARFAAACLVAVAILAGVWAWLAPRPASVYATEIAEQRSILLPDGSNIKLNARSTVRIRFSPAERRVELLEGQALFDVAKDERRPFVVQSGETSVRALGTRFDVHQRTSETTVTVLAGRVAVGPALLQAGEQVTVKQGTATTPKRADPAAATAWTHHRLVFEGDRLADVAEEFNRFNRRQLIIEDAALQDFHVSGVYSSTDPASLIRFLQNQPGVSVLETDESVRITRH